MKTKQIWQAFASATMIMMSVSTSLAMDTTTTSFKDVPVSHPNYTAIMDLKSRGMINGYPDGTFKPDQVVNRVEALKIILLGAGLNVPEAQGTGGFKDTIATEWYAKYLLKAKELKIVAGYPDGTFKPTQTVNLVENLKMLINTKGTDLTDINVTENPYADAFKDQWYAKYVQYAKIQKWITANEKNMIYPSQGMTRGKLAEVLYNSLKGTTTNPTTTPAPSPTPTPSPSSVTQSLVDLNVSMEGYMFNKKTMTIAQGTKVRWTNKDSVTHTVTSDDGKFDSGNIAPGQTFEYTFNDLGTFNYHSTPYSTMTGTITVKKAIEVPTV